MNKERKLTICKSIANYKRPRVILEGKWFEEMGFNIGDLISVNGDNGEITIKKIGTYEDKLKQQSVYLLKENDISDGDIVKVVEENGEYKLEKIKK